MDEEEEYCEEDYCRELDNILQRYEIAAREEQYYLLQSVFKLPNSNYELQCGLSPARTFTPIILITRGACQITCSTYEWLDLINILKDIQTSFFHPSCQPDETFLLPIQCSDVISISRIINRENTKLVSIHQYFHSLDLTEKDVGEILDMAMSSVLRSQVKFLEDLNFCMFYENVLKIVKTIDKNIVSLQEILYAFSEAFSYNSVYGNALKQYLYYYKHKVVKDLEKN